MKKKGFLFWRNFFEEDFADHDARRVLLNLVSVDGSSPAFFYVSSRISSSWDKNEKRKWKALTEQARFGNQFNSVGFILFCQRTTPPTAQSHRRKFICFITVFVLAKNQKTNHCNLWKATCIQNKKRWKKPASNSKEIRGNINWLNWWTGLVRM